MSAFEQKVEAPDRAWQYLLFAAEPYETIGFKIPSLEVDRSRFHTHWDEARKVFTLQLYFRERSGPGPAAAAGSATAGSAPGASAGAGGAAVAPAVAAGGGGGGGLAPVVYGR